MTTYIINTPILTNYGIWDFRGPLTLAESQEIIDSGFVSAVGHSASADFLSHLLDRKIPVARIQVSMKPNDRAIIFRLLQRLPEGKVLNREELSGIPYELGLLSRTE